MVEFNPFNVPEFRAELAALLDEKLEPLLDLKAKVSAVEATVGDHEKAIQRSRGAVWVLSGLWALLVSLVSGHIWLGHRQP